MKSIYRISIISYSLLLSLIFSYAQANTLATRDNKHLSQTDIDNMIYSGEQIAKHPFSSLEKRNLSAWAIDIYNKEKNFRGILSAFNKYNSYRALAKKYHSPETKELIWHHFYREMTFNWYFPVFKKNQKTIYSIIQKYNPILIKLNSEKMILAKKDLLMSKKGEFFLSSPMIFALETVAKFLANAQISSKSLQRMRPWSKDDFNQNPQEATKVYAYFLDEIVPMALNQVKNYKRESFREATYQNYYFIFKQDAIAKRWNNDLMDIVTDYNPTIISDIKHKKLVSQNELNIRVNFIRFFSKELNLPIPSVNELFETERNNLIEQFINRKNKNQYKSSAAYLIRVKNHWISLNKTQRSTLATQIKKNNKKTNQFWETLKPVFAQTNSIINKEQQELLAQQQLINNMILQSMQTTQMVFNQTLQTQRNFNNTITESIKDFGTRQAIHLSGSKVISTYDNFYIIEDESGNRYELSK